MYGTLPFSGFTCILIIGVALLLQAARGSQPSFHDWLDTVLTGLSLLCVDVIRSLR